MILEMKRFYRKYIWHILFSLGFIMLMNMARQSYSENDDHFMKDSDVLPKEPPSDIEFKYDIILKSATQHLNYSNIKDNGKTKILNKNILSRRKKRKQTNFNMFTCNLRDDVNLYDQISTKNDIVVHEKLYMLYNPMVIDKKIPFLKYFKNPCFLQNLSTIDPYKGVTHDSRLSLKAIHCAKDVFTSRIDNNEKVRMRCFPQFFVAGVQKCGTTDLQNMLPVHEQITTFTIKENHWWNRGRFKMNDGPTPITLEGYLDLFDVPAETILREFSSHDGNKLHSIVAGDISPAMLWDQGFWRLLPENKGTSEPKILVPHLIRHILPNTKFIIMLRNPSDRLYSDYLFFHPGSRTPELFHQKVLNAIAWFNSCVKRNPLRACFYDAIDPDPYTSDANREENPWWHPAFRLRIGLYYIFIKDLLDVFPKDQVFVLRLEDYSNNRTNWLSKIFKFLNLNPDPELKEKIGDDAIYNKNKKGYKLHGNMLPRTRMILDSFYNPYNLQLAELLNNETFKWAN